MKRRMAFLMTIVLVFITLVGCGASPQKQYVDYLKQSQERQGVKSEFELQVKDIILDSKNADPMLGVGLSQLKTGKLSGMIVQDKDKKNRQAMELNLEMMGIQIPIQMTMNNQDVYISLDFFTNIFDLAKAFDEDEDIEMPKEFKDLKGKYVLIKANEEIQKQSKAKQEDNKTEKKKAKEKNEQFSEKEMEAFIIDSQKAANEYFSKMDSKRFVKNNDEISVTFNKKDFVELFNILDEVKKKDKKYQKLDIDFKELGKSLGVFKELQLSGKVDVKKNTQKYLYSMVAKNSEEAGFKKIVLSMKTKQSEDKQSVKLPAKNKVISEKEMEKVFGNNSNPLLDMQDGPVSTEEYTDEEVEELKQSLIENKDSLTKEQKDGILFQLKMNLSEEQYKEIEEALK